MHTPQQTLVTLYKDTKDTKLGITFFRRDPQDGAQPGSAIISRIGATGPAAGLLNVGERIMTVQGVPVDGPLHAARLLRESEGFMKIGKLPKRADFDDNLERYQQIEAEAARAAMAAALPGQTAQSTPRTDAATPRGPGGNVPTQFASGLRPLNQGGPPGLDMSALDTTGAQLSARAQAAQQNIAEGWGQLSARAGKMFEGWGNKVAGLGEIIPTQANKETRAARKIQAAWRSCAARGHFHEERGAVLMLQSAQRRVKAQKAAQYKKAMKHWAAVVIQERYRRYKLKQKKQALENTPKKQGIGSKIVKSLSFSRRSAKKAANPKPDRPVDITDEDLVSARGQNPEPARSLGQPLAQSETPTGGQKKRTLSFTRRKKAAAAESPAASVPREKVSL